MAEFFIAMVVVGILGIIPIVLIDIYSNANRTKLHIEEKDGL